jgi:predicted ATPase
MVKYAGYIRTQGGADNILYFGVKQSSYLSVKVSTNENDDSSDFHVKMIPDINGDLVFSSNTLLGIDIGKHSSGFATIRKPLYSESIKAIFENFRVYHFNDTGFTSAVKQPANTIDYAYLHEDGGNIAAFLYRIQETSPKHFNLIVDVIQSIASFIDRFILKPDEINSNQIFLRWQEKGSEKLFSAANLSDGTLRIICLTALLIQPDPPPVIIIDEPELGLHPYAISKIAAMIKGASEKTQVIIATQSVNLVNEFSANDIIVVEREKQQTVFKRQSEDKLAEWLKDYSLGDLWERNILGSNL